MVDTHIMTAVICDVPSGEDYTSYFPKFNNIVKRGGEGCLYFGFASSGDGQVLCREGHKNAEAFLAHSKEVQHLREELIKKLGKEHIRIVCCGPAAELAKVRPHIEGRLPIKLVELDSGAIQLNSFPSGGHQDTHITILAEFAVPEERMAMAKRSFSNAYSTTEGGASAEGLLYYGFAVWGESVYCRQGYQDGAACLAHAKDVKKMDADILKNSGIKALNVVGPKSELAKLRSTLGTQGAVFWELDAGAFWK